VLRCSCGGWREISTHYLYAADALVDVACGASTQCAAGLRAIPQQGDTRDAQVATIGNGHPMHWAQDPTAAPLRMGRARMENKKTGKRRQHIVRRRRNLERSKRARIKEVPGLSSDSGPTPPGTSVPVVTDERA